MACKALPRIYAKLEHVGYRSQRQYNNLIYLGISGSGLYGLLEAVCYLLPSCACTTIARIGPAIQQAIFTHSEYLLTLGVTYVVIRTGRVLPLGLFFKSVISSPTKAEAS